MINKGNPEVTASFGTVNSITNRASLTFFDAGANSVAGDVTNSHDLVIDPSSGDGGSSLTIGGALTNSGTVSMGPSDGTLSAASTIEAGSLVNFSGPAYGTIDLTGSSTMEVTLDVASAAGFGAAGVLYGDVNLSRDALIEFKSGQIKTIAADSTLALNGSDAFVADAGKTSSNSALGGLDILFGKLDLSNGATVTTSGALTNSGTISLDQFTDVGGSSLTIGGALTNDGTIQVGPSDGTLSAASTIEAGSLANFNGGTIDLAGSSTAEATLDVASAAGFVAAGVLDGNVNLSGDALIEFKSGQITTIEAHSTLALNGSDAFVADAGKTSSNSALGGLDIVFGKLDLSNGATVTTSGALTNSGTISLDQFTDVGGSSLTIGGALTNDGTIQVGPSDGTLSAASTIEAGSLANFNGGTIDLAGSSTLDVASAAGFGAAGVLYGDVNLSYGALIEFKSGQITTIAAHSTLALTGSNAFLTDVGNTSSNNALDGLDRVAGDLLLENGATVTTSGALTNSGSIALSSTIPPSSNDGGSVLKANDGGYGLNIGGTLTNSGTIGVEENTLTAASVINHGTISLFFEATLNSPGAFTNDGSVYLSGNSDQIAGAIGGTGDFSLSEGSTLEFGAGVSSSETVTFGSGVNHLILDSPSLFNGTIDDFFHKGDSVVVNGFAKSATTLHYTPTGADSCALTLTDGANTAVLTFAGEPYTQGDFSIVSADGGAGSAIKFV